MNDRQYVKIRLTREEASIIAEAIKQKPGESLAAALKKFFTKNHTQKVDNNDGRSNIR